MVQKIFNILSREINNIHGVAYLLGFFAILTQILALVRDRLLASNFGAGTVLDIYYASFRIPDLIFVTVASLVSISILIPFFTEAEEKGFNTKNLIDGIFSLFFILILLVSSVAFVLIPYVTPFLFPGIVGAESDSLILMSRILLLSPIFLGLSNFFASIVQMHNRFFLYALSPILYNIGIISGIIFLYPVYGIYGLVLGVCLGAFMHCAVQIPFIIEKKSFPKITLNIDFEVIKKIIFLSVPRTITLSTGSISAFFLIGIASVIGVGAITIFNFSFNLQTGPLSIIGVSYASAVFPVLSRRYIQCQKNSYLSKIINVTKHIIFWSMPATALLVVLRAQIVRTVLGAGVFNWSDTRLTAAALAIFALSMIPQSMVLLFIRAFYAEGKTSKPLVLNIISMMVTIGCGYLFIYLYQTFPILAYFFQNLLRIEDVPGSAVVMLALAFSFGITLNMVLHWFAFEKEYQGFTGSILDVLFKSTASAIIIGYVSHYVVVFLNTIYSPDTLLGVFFTGLVAGLTGLLIGIIVLKFLKCKELDEVISAIHRKIWKNEKNIVADELL